MCAFCCKYLQLFTKIPLLYENNLFDNSVNMYSSISGHTVENRSDKTSDPHYIWKHYRRFILLDYPSEHWFGPQKMRILFTTSIWLLVVFVNLSKIKQTNLTHLIFTSLESHSPCRSKLISIEAISWKKRCSFVRQILALRINC